MVMAHFLIKLANKSLKSILNSLELSTNEIFVPQVKVPKIWGLIGFWLTYRTAYETTIIMCSTYL